MNMSHDERAALYALLHPKPAKQSTDAPRKPSALSERMARVRAALAAEKASR